MKVYYILTAALFSIICQESFTMDEKKGEGKWKSKPPRIITQFVINKVKNATEQCKKLSRDLENKKIITEGWRTTLNNYLKKDEHEKMTIDEIWETFRVLFHGDCAFTVDAVAESIHDRENVLDRRSVPYDDSMQTKLLTMGENTTIHFGLDREEYMEKNWNIYTKELTKLEEVLRNKETQFCRAEKTKRPVLCTYITNTLDSFNKASAYLKD